MIHNTKDLLLKGNVVEGLTEAQDLINTPVATEITEDFAPLYPSGIPESPAEFFYENELLRKKISKNFFYYSFQVLLKMFICLDEVSTSMINEFIQSTMAPISKQLIETDTSLINTQVVIGF